MSTSVVRSTARNEGKERELDAETKPSTSTFSVNEISGSLSPASTDTDIMIIRYAYSTSSMHFRDYVHVRYGTYTLHV